MIWMASAAYKVQCTTISRIFREMSTFLFVNDILTTGKRLHVNIGKRVSLLFYTEKFKYANMDPVFLVVVCVCVCDNGGHSRNINKH